MHQFLPQVLLLLGAAVAVIVAFQRLHIPSSLGYLLVGVILGPYTAGPVVEDQPIRDLAELGIVFLLFTIGLNFSPPQIRALRDQVLKLGTGQVVLTTTVVAFAAWLGGLPAAVAFVIGAVFAQSSTTIISKQLAEQGESNTPHSRLAVAMSVFQDVTAVPFVVIIPALGATAGAAALATSLGWAVAKAALAFALVYAAGHWVLRPLFHVVAERRSAEAFTLTVLFVSLVAAWTTSSLGLSMAFGAFLVGMMLGETEFRHQVEAAIRPFRDVLLGLFFIGIGMLFDPGAVVQIWPLALLGAAVLLLSKTLIVTLLVRWSGVPLLSAWRTGLLLAVGGEFGLALIAIALGAGVIDGFVGQVALTSVLFSMFTAPLLIRFNGLIARVLTPRTAEEEEDRLPVVTKQLTGQLHDHTIICGYGRIGQSVGHFLEEEDIPYVALDLDPAKVRQAHIAGEPVFYGDAAEPGILEAVGIDSARLVVISHPDVEAALRILEQVRNMRPELPVMVRTRDESHLDTLREAGASEVVPETLEAGLMIASQALLLLNTPLSRVIRRMQEQRAGRYRLLREFAIETAAPETAPTTTEGDRLRPVPLPDGSPAVGCTLADLALERVAVTALVREGNRQLTPPDHTELRPGDVLVLFGTAEDLDRAERVLRGA